MYLLHFKYGYGQSNNKMTIIHQQYKIVSSGRYT